MRPNLEMEPDTPNRDRDPTTGRAVPGNQLARKYPKPPDENDPQVALRLAERREQALSDRGGRDHVSHNLCGAIDRLVVLELFLESWEQYFMRAGLITRQGRVRSGFSQGYLATVNQYMRLLQLVGLDRVERPVNETPIEWLERRARERDGSGTTTADEPAKHEPQDEKGD